MTMMQNLDNFCSGHLIVDKHKRIVFCNHYISNLCGSTSEEMINKPIEDYFTKASTIFINSHIYPLLLKNLVVHENQVTWLGKNGQRIPVVVNLKLAEDQTSYWSIFVCANQDQLQQELITSKEKLEKQSEELFRLATTDPLTGLLNRRELLAQANKLSHQLNRNRSNMALLFADIDFFKRINDIHGHQVGDQVLQDVAKLLLEGRRANDLVARVGGEEFVLLLPDVNAKDAFLLAENIRNRIATQTLSELDVRISIGLVVTDKNKASNFDGLLDAADKALYKAKAEGRNRTSMVAPE